MSVCLTLAMVSLLHILITPGAPPPQSSRRLYIYPRTKLSCLILALMVVDGVFVVQL